MSSHSNRNGNPKYPSRVRADRVLEHPERWWLEVRLTKAEVEGLRGGGADDDGGGFADEPGPDRAPASGDNDDDIPF